ncbi:MAG: S8 family serine peptidase, partial [Clostridiales bacterium]|nr:S8 family serine peptidase [Clostridiales bacterium]
MKNQNVKKIIAVMLAGTLLFGAAGIWTASAAEMSEDMEESAVEAETELTADSSASLNQTQVVADIQEADDAEADLEIYTELMDYVDATSALLAKYPCDYDGTLDIDIDSGEITDQNGEIVNAMDDAMEAAVDSDDANDAAENLAESGYVVLDVDDTMVSVEDPYQTMRLIVTAEEGLVSSYGAEAVISYQGEYILQYTSTEDTINAYMALAADSCVDELYVDAVVSAYENEEDEAVSSYALSDENGEDVYLSWGVETMGLDVMQENLEATDTEESTEDDLEEVVVAVIDSGVNAENVYLDGRILSEDGYDCYNEDDDASDDYGHGTHVAGIIADGTSDNVKILPVKVIDSSGNGTVLTVINGRRCGVGYGGVIRRRRVGLGGGGG